MADMSQDQFNKMMKMMEGILKASGGSGNDPKLQKMLNDLRKREHSLLSKSNEALDDQAKTIKSTVGKLDGAFRTLQSSVYQSGDAAEQFLKIYKKANVGLKKQSGVLSSLLDNRLQNDKFDEFSDKIMNSAKNLKFLNKHFDGALTTINDLDNAQRDASVAASTFKKAMEDNGGSLSAVFKELSKKVAESGEASLSQQERAMYKLAESSKLLEADDDTIRKHIKGVEAEVKAISKSTFQEYAKIKAMMEVKEKLGVFGKALGIGIGPMAALTAAMGLLAHGIKGAWQQMTLIGESGMYAQWDNIKWAQVELGISFEEAVKIFQQNTRVLNSIGGEKFKNTLESAGKELRIYGLNQLEAAEATADFTKNAALSGINIRDNDTLTKSIQMQTAAFGKLRATTGTSIEEFKSFTAEMIGNNDIQSTLNGLNQVDRMNKMKDMMELRQRFVNLGMSAQTAQKAMVAMQELGKQKVTDRFSQAAKLKQALMMYGIAGADQAANTHLMGARASEQQKLQQAATLQELQKHIDMSAFGDFTGEKLGEVIGEMTDPFKSIMQAGREASLTEEGQGKISEDRAKELAQLSKIPEVMAEGNKKIAQIMTGLNDPVVKAILGIGALISGLVVTAIGSSASKISSAIKSSGSKQIQAEAVETGKVVSSVNNVENAVRTSSQSVGDTMEGGPSGRRNRKKQGGKKGKRGGKGGALSAMASSVTGSSGCCNEMGNIANTLGDVAEDLASDKIGDQVAKKTGRWAAAKSMMGKGIGAAGRFIGSAASIGARASGIGTAAYGMYEGGGLMKDAWDDVQAKKRGEQRELTWKNDWDVFWKEVGEVPGKVGDAIVGTTESVSDKVQSLIAEGKTAEQARNIATNSISAFGDLSSHSAAGIISEMAGLASAEPVAKQNSVVNPHTETQQDKSRAKEEQKTSSVDVKTPKTEAEYLKDMGTYLTELKDINTETNNINKLQVELLSALVKTNKEADEYMRSKMTGNLNGFGIKTENSYINFLTSR